MAIIVKSLVLDVHNGLGIEIGQVSFNRAKNKADTQS